MQLSNEEIRQLEHIFGFARKHHTLRVDRLNEEIAEIAPAHLRFVDVQLDESFENTLFIYDSQKRCRFASKNFKRVSDFQREVHILQQLTKECSGDFQLIACALCHTTGTQILVSAGCCTLEELVQYRRANKIRWWERAGELQRTLRQLIFAVKDVLAKRGFYHCDLRPSNIVLFFSESSSQLLQFEARLGDFVQTTQDWRAAVSERQHPLFRRGVRVFESAEERLTAELYAIARCLQYAMLSSYEGSELLRAESLFLDQSEEGLNASIEFLSEKYAVAPHLVTVLREMLLGREWGTYAKRFSKLATEIGRSESEELGTKINHINYTLSFAWEAESVEPEDLLYKLQQCDSLEMHTRALQMLDVVAAKKQLKTSWATVSAQQTKSSLEQRVYIFYYRLLFLNATAQYESCLQLYESSTQQELLQSGLSLQYKVRIEVQHSIAVRNLFEATARVRRNEPIFKNLIQQLLKIEALCEQEKNSPLLALVVKEIAEVQLVRGFYDNSLSEVQRAIALYRQSMHERNAELQSAIFLQERILHESVAQMERHHDNEKHMEMDAMITSERRVYADLDGGNQALAAADLAALCCRERNYEKAQTYFQRAAEYFAQQKQEAARAKNILAYFETLCGLARCLCLQQLANSVNLLDKHSNTTTTTTTPPPKQGADAPAKQAYELLTRAYQLVFDYEYEKKTSLINVVSGRLFETAQVMHFWDSQELASIRASSARFKKKFLLSLQAHSESFRAKGLLQLQLCYLEVLRVLQLNTPASAALSQQSIAELANAIMETKLRRALEPLLERGRANLEAGTHFEDDLREVENVLKLSQETQDNVWLALSDSNAAMSASRHIQNPTALIVRYAEPYVLQRVHQMVQMAESFQHKQQQNRAISSLLRAREAIDFLLPPGSTKSIATQKNETTSLPQLRASIDTLLSVSFFSKSGKIVRLAFMDLQEELQSDARELEQLSRSCELHSQLYASQQASAVSNSVGEMSSQLQESVKKRQVQSIQELQILAVQPSFFIVKRFAQRIQSLFALKQEAQDCLLSAQSYDAFKFSQMLPLLQQKAVERIQNFAQSNAPNNSTTSAAISLEFLYREVMVSYAIVCLIEILQPPAQVQDVTKVCEKVGRTVADFIANFQTTVTQPHITDSFVTLQCTKNFEALKNIEKQVFESVQDIKQEFIENDQVKQMAKQNKMQQQTGRKNTTSNTQNSLILIKYAKKHRPSSNDQHDRRQLKQGVSGKKDNDSSSSFARKRRSSWSNRKDYPQAIQQLLQQPLKLEEQHKYYHANRQYLRIMKKAQKTKIRIEIADRISENLEIQRKKLKKKMEQLKKGVVAEAIQP